MSLKNIENMNLFLAIFFLLVLFLVFTPIAFSHGGKHAPEEFTHLQALKKATKLYDKLIEKGKLDQSWENKLSQVDVFKRGTDDKYEIVVSFERTEGDPKIAYIFFNTSGKYVGSNFTGE
ncbi:MAG: DUF6488 family protein [Desulfobacterales bacterium]